MKVVIAIIFLIVVGCDSASDMATSPLPHSMKGYELYSWQTNGDWNHTLIMGTNRLKTIEEITDPENIEEEWVKITVKHSRNLKALIERLPSGESLSWRKEPPQFELPSASVVSEIEAICKVRNIDLYINQ